MRARIVCLAFLVACGGTYGGKPSSTGPAASGGPKRGIEAAALPYSVLDGRTGRQIPTPTFWTQLGDARVVCVGEDHPNPHHHWFQLEVMTQIAAGKHDTRLALGMEMFQRPFQGVLDDYATHHIDDAALLSRSGWSERWNYDWGFYRPTIAKAIASGAALLALNAPRELTKKVVRQGLESLTPDERKQIPELDLADKAHRAWFDDIMEGMGGSHAHGGGGGGGATGGHKTPEPDAKPDPADAKPADAKPAEAPPAGMPSADRIYTVQVIWDETMADGAAKWLAANPNGYLVLLAGNGHCHDSAIVNRIKRRGVPQVVSIHPVLDTDGRVAEALAKPINDYVVVLELPADVKARMEKEEAENAAE